MATTNNLAPISNLAVASQPVSRDAMDDPDAAFKAAWHEAGHAIVGELLRPGSVQAVGLNDSGGYTNATTPQGKTNTNQLTPDEIRNLVAASYAGGMVEPGGTTAKHVSVDQNHRSDILMGAGTTPLANLARIVTGHTIGTDPVLEANQRQAEAKARVNALLADPNTRDMIDALTVQIASKKNLTGDDVRDVMSKFKASK